MPRKKLTKAEIKNIINDKWTERRAVLKKRSKANSIAAKKWKAEEKNIQILLTYKSRIKNESDPIVENIDKFLSEAQKHRLKHYITTPPQD